MSDVLNSLLSASIDDLNDLPEFAVFPAGSHKVRISFSEKTVNDHPSVELAMTLIEHNELANPAEDQPLAPGAEGSILFMLDNEFGQGKLKAVLKPLAAHFGTSSLRETMDAAKGAEIDVVTKIRKNKDKDQTYMEIVKVIL
jgi:hypothetical protein